MTSTNYKPWMRYPRTTAEKRANQNGWCRGKRMPNSLPDAYEDIWLYAQKGWKKKGRKKQYYTGGRGEHHSMRVEEEPRWSWWRRGYRDRIDRLEEYCKDYDIPYRIETCRRFRWTERQKWIKTGKYEWVTLFEDYTYKREITKCVGTGEYYRSWYTDHYVFHWWYDKDIGVDHI